MSDIGLKKDCLPENTRKVFEWLAAEPLLKDFILMGGTALANGVTLSMTDMYDFFKQAVDDHEVAMTGQLKTILKNAFD